jgi:hypothetical protein
MRQALLITLAVVATSAAPLRAAEPIPALAAKASGVTVSGISSGGYMAGQYQLAYSSSIAGVGIIAAGPWGCAQGRPRPWWWVDWWWLPRGLWEAQTALGPCMAGSDGGPDIAASTALARGMAEAGTIQPLAGLADDRIYLFTGRSDRTVMPEVVRRAGVFYRGLGVQDSAVMLDAGREGGHGLPIDGPSPDTSRCAETGPPFVNECNFDLAGAMLQHLLGPAPEPAPVGPRAGLTTIDQASMVPQREAGRWGLDDEAFLHVPAACAMGGCGIHVFFHGCQQQKELQGMAIAQSSGFARWAEAYRLVVLFPQAKATSDNPRGCWDWWGYSGRDFLAGTAPQLAAVHAMVNRLSAQR